MLSILTGMNINKSKIWATIDPIFFFLRRKKKTLDLALSRIRGSWLEGTRTKHAFRKVLEDLSS